MTNTTQIWRGWYFNTYARRLRYGDNRPIKVGETHTIPDTKELLLCQYGLHASKTVFEALDYAPGNILYRVELIGTRKDQRDKSCAYQRKYLYEVDAEPVLRRFAKDCALSVIHLWEVPEIVKLYLQSDSEVHRIKARDAAWDVAWSAARDAARGMARGAAWDAARDAAWSAARNKQQNILEQKCLQLLPEEFR